MKLPIKETANWLITWAVILAAMVVAYHVYQVRREIPFVASFKVEDPVILDKEVYYYGEVVTGHFIGERTRDVPTIFNRTLVCKDFRALLKPIRAEKLPVGRFDTTAILTVSDDILLTDTEIGDRDGCEIIFATQSVVDQYILGGEKLQQEQSYRTTKFNIRRLQP